MKTKLVLWGNDKDDNRVLIALELLSSDNQVVLRVVPQDTATEELYTQLMDKWRENEETVFPEDTIITTQELTLAETLLPEDIKVEKTDIVNKAQAEWHFIVLSEKLYASYVSNIEMLKEKIVAVTSFNKGLWEELKAIQGKIQAQYNERNIQREHIGDLRNRVNELFDSLKLLRAAQDAEFREESNVNFEKLAAQLGTIENQISEGARFSVVFDSLKTLQRNLKSSKLVREQRNELWERVDNAFKVVKEKRFGVQQAETGNTTALQRVTRRYTGLLSAIERMESSIKKDRQELNEQLDKIKHSRFDGVLEQQISQAKMNMIENRITSKESKLNEMNATRAELEGKIANIKEKEEKRLAKEAQKAAQAAEKAAQAALLAKEMEVTKAAEAAKVAEVEAVTEAVAEVTEVVEEKVEAAVETATEKVEAVVETATETVEVVAEATIETTTEEVTEETSTDENTDNTAE